MKRSRIHINNPRFNYLSDEDRYFLARPEPRYRLAIIGLGINGREHLRNTYLEGNAEVVGVYDPHQGSVDAAVQVFREMQPGKELRCYQTLEKAIADDAVDGFVISTPNYTHREVLSTVITAGKPILLEKPMATTIEDAAAIVELVNGSGVEVQVGLQYRFKSIYVEALHEAQERRSIGELKTIAIREHRIPFLDKVGQWNKFSEYSGGTLVEKCCHYFDLFNLFAGAAPVRVFASGSQAVNYQDFSYHGRTSDIYDNATVIVEYENGIRATFDLSMFVPMMYEEMVLCGDGGRLRAYEQEDFLSNEGLQTGLEVYRGEEGPSRQSSPRYPSWLSASGHSGATVLEHAAFIGLLSGNRGEAATVEEGFWSIVVGAAAEESAHTGQPIEIGEFVKSKQVRVP